MQELMKKLEEKLTRRQIELLWLINPWGGNLSLREAGKRLGISERAVYVRFYGIEKRIPGLRDILKSAKKKDSELKEFDRKMKLWENYTPDTWDDEVRNKVRKPILSYDIRAFDPHGNEINMDECGYAITKTGQIDNIVERF